MTSRSAACLIRPPSAATLTWRSQIPCDTSVYTVAKAREYCGSTENGAAGGCPGWYRWRCSNDRNKSCQFHEDCSENGDKGAVSIPPHCMSRPHHHLCRVELRFSW